MTMNQQVLEQLRSVSSQHPGVELEAVVETSIGFIINGGFTPEELLEMTPERLGESLDELTQEQAASMDMRGAADTGHLLEVRDLNSGKSLWPPETEGEAPAVAGPRFCPHCGKETLQPDLGAFVEQGDYDGKRYTAEGDAEGYSCTSCGQGFLDWTICDGTREAIKVAEEQGGL